MSRMLQRNRVRLGFTLVELLVVIAIIGLLIGLLVPAVGMAWRSASRATIKLEVDGLSKAIEDYRTKYNDYPPDGSSWIVFERHMRKAFPQILSAELDLINPLTRSVQNGWSTAKVANDSEAIPNAADMRVMEPAEALVFFLGGFSEDPQRPMTGTGGPFVATGNPAQPWQYNPSRLNGLYDFKANRLTTTVVNGFTISDDEATFQLPDVQNGGNQTSDLLPVYKALLTNVPYVYFDSRTYASNKGTVRYFNRYRFYNEEVRGVDTVRPYKSDTTLNAASPNADMRFKYMNDKSFQVLAPGLDAIYAAAPTADWNDVPILFKFPSGASDVGSTGFSAYKHPGITGTYSPQNDNVGNFSRTTLEAGLQ